MQMTEIKIERTQKGIEEYCRRFLYEEYGIKLNVPVEINNRLRKRLGSFYRSENQYGEIKSHKLEFAGILLKNATDEQIISVAKHECIHLSLFELGLPFDDGDEYFENELKKHNSDSTQTLEVKREANINLYKCDCYTHVMKRKLKYDPSMYTCQDCNSGLVFLGKEKRMIEY